MYTSQASYLTEGPLHWICLMFPHDWIQTMIPLAEIPQKGCCIFLNASHQEAHSLVPPVQLMLLETVQIFCYSSNFHPLSPPKLSPQTFHSMIAFA